MADVRRLGEQVAQGLDGGLAGDRDGRRAVDGHPGSGAAEGDFRHPFEPPLAVLGLRGNPQLEAVELVAGAEHVGRLHGGPLREHLAAGSGRKRLVDRQAFGKTAVPVAEKDVYPLAGLPEDRFPREQVERLQFVAQADVDVRVDRHIGEGDEQGILEAGFHVEERPRQDRIAVGAAPVEVECFVAQEQVRRLDA